MLYCPTGYCHTFITTTGGKVNSTDRTCYEHKHQDNPLG